MERLNSDEYKQFLSDIRECQRIAKDLGLFNPDTAFFEELQLELKFLGYGRLSLNVLGAVSLWRKTKNTFYMDLIQIWCREPKLPIGPLLRNEIDFAASRRFSDAAQGTLLQVKKDGAKGAILHFMLNMIYVGLSVHDASKKAAWFYQRQFPDLKPLKASVFEKEYPRSSYGKDQKMLFSNWDKEKVLNRSAWEENRLVWERIIQNVPDCTDDLIGERR